MLFEADARLNIGRHFRHGLLHVKQVCFLTELGGNVLLVGFRRQNLFHFFDTVALRLQHMAHAPECEFYDISDSAPLASCLE